MTDPDIFRAALLARCVVLSTGVCGGEVPVGRALSDTEGRGAPRSVFEGRRRSWLTLSPTVGDPNERRIRPEMSR